MLPFPLRWIERDYVAVCIAEQIVRRAPGPAGAATARSAVAELVRLAEALEMRERVLALVSEACRRPRGVRPTAAARTLDSPVDVRG
jgi:hypothetical protein